ncbi:MAG: TetR/AcrR family transcriptional regulator [Thermoleophilaceae bacterium]
MRDVKIDDQLLIPAGRHTLPPEQVSRLQKERLLRAIVQCACDRGYQAMTIADIVRVARTSRSAFYEHFADKESCFLEAYRQMTGAFIEASLEAAAKEAEWQDKLDAGIATYFSWMAEHPEVATTTLIEIHAVGPAGLEARAGALADWMRVVAGVAVLARRAGAPIPELDEVAYAAIIVTAEAHVHDYARRARVEDVEEVTAAVQAIARALFEHGVPPQTRRHTSFAI